MKAQAPPPPSVPQPAPRKIFRNVLPDGGVPDTKENPALSSVDLQVTLPNGAQTSVSVDGRRALMDILVDLCAQYHLNPADHTLELVSAEGHSVPFKPNTALAALDVSRALIRKRTFDDRAPRRPAPVPRVPEKTVRLVVNYHRGQKTVVRVSPVVPLESLVPIICQKCDFDPVRVLLLRDAVSQHELDLHKSLVELDIRELYVLDQTLAESLRSDAPSASGGEKKGILGLLRLNRRKSKDESRSNDTDQHNDGRTLNTQADFNGHSTVSTVCVEARPSTLGQSQSAMNLSRISPKIEPKKRRAPAPPPPPAQTVIQIEAQPSSAPASQTKPPSPKLETQVKKRKAPAPPPSTTPCTTFSVPVMPAVHIVKAPGQSDDSVSDLSHSVDDSEAAASICSSANSDDDAESSSLAEELMPELEPGPEMLIEKAKSSTPQPPAVPEAKPPTTLSSTSKQDPDDSDSELKVEEVDNTRHSAMAWLHPEEKEAESMSVCSSESFADQGYAASEGMADSPSASSEDTVSLCPDHSPSPSQPHDDSDVDEGCATWGSRHSNGDVQGEHQSVKRQDSPEEPEMTAQIHLTLTDLDADLVNAGDQPDEASVCEKDDIPVSVVDLDIPITTIDEVLDGSGSSITAYEPKLLRSDSIKQESSTKLMMNLQNTNNNAQMSDKMRKDQALEDHNRSGSQQIEMVASKIKGEELEEPKAPQKFQKPVLSPVTKNPPESKVYPSSKASDMEDASYAKELTAPHGKITQNPVSRFGLKTFTIVPPKPTVPYIQKKAGSLRTGAIKIDEFGNMVKQRETQDKPVAETHETRSSLLGKAKAFWSSAEKQDPAPPSNKVESVKTKEAEAPKSDVPITVILQEGHMEKPTDPEPPKQVTGSTGNMASAVMKKLAVSDHAESMFFSEHRRNIIMPSRRTSSQYVASAIAKYSGNSLTKTTAVQESPESPPGPEKPPANQGLRPAATANSVPYNLGPRRSQSYPSHIAETLEVSKQQQFISSSTTQKSATTKAQESLDPKPTQTCPKENPYLKKGPGHLPTPPNDIRPPVSKKPELLSPVTPPEPNQAGLFGPVRKFKPVVPKKVEQETSLHSSLMEAIQSGEGIDRLRKVSDSSRTGTLKKPLNTEPENERDALLSAIRAQSNSARLKKTRSEAAAELEQFRKAEKDRPLENQTSASDPPSFTLGHATSFIPPPPPPAFIPPPPPPPQPTSKPALVLPAGRNPEGAREAMLEAIRSGSGAKQLRKVPVTLKTVKVNGRLGIIRAPPPPSQAQ